MRCWREGQGLPVQGDPLTSPLPFALADRLGTAKTTPPPPPERRSPPAEAKMEVRARARVFLRPDSGEGKGLGFWEVDEKAGKDWTAEISEEGKNWTAEILGDGLRWRVDGRLTTGGALRSCS
ncbi:uncharacterized protein A4U43_C07F1570 [Asparagus officinalis]|uniref:Uncharacterized protein n=1 Tax=Asparagus officinalis TaxID=4686 RepID=A0A5P1E8H9_ASPOF|nr:uncharacterized protein A4U43_C07F1570 [Asparagus officinalis]